jgi:Holliday junction DNA helicase RuvA
MLSVHVGELIDLQIRQIFSEDDQRLFGFRNRQACDLFDLLISVNACGPKVAMAILSELGERTITEAVLRGDADTLRRVSGVGPKLAQRILLELGGKLEGVVTAAVQDGASLEQTTQEQLIEALMSLGYKRQEAARLAATVAGKNLSIEAALREALSGAMAEK